jgi:hypothetical protein
MQTTRAPRPQQGNESQRSLGHDPEKWIPATPPGQTGDPPPFEAENVRRKKEHFREYRIRHFRLQTRRELAAIQLIELHRVPCQPGQDIELAANSQRVSERLCNLLAVDEGNELAPFH